MKDLTNIPTPICDEESYCLTDKKDAYHEVIPLSIGIKLERERAVLYGALNRFKIWADKWADSSGTAQSFKGTEQYKEMERAIALIESNSDESPTEAK